MKKSIIIFLISLLILNIFVISLIKAENEDSALPPEFAKYKTITGNLTDSNRFQYLKQEWGKILEKNKLMGPIIRGAEKTQPYLDPIFNLVLGIPSSLTWLFILTLIIWVSLAIYIFRFLELFSIVSKFTQYLIYIATMIVWSWIRISKFFAEKIINTLSLFTTWWVQLIGMGVVILILILASVFSKQLKEFFEKAKERRKKNKEEANRMELEKNAKISNMFTKGITNSESSYDSGFTA